MAAANMEGEVVFRAEDRELRKAKIVTTEKNNQDKNKHLLKRSMFLFFRGFKNLKK